MTPAGLDRRTARRLKRGQLAAEARLDLHGKTQDEAHGALRCFIQESRMTAAAACWSSRARARSRAGGAACCARWCRAGSTNPALRRHIVAITNAPERNGGTGALYVLLKSREALDPDRGAG